MFISVPYINKQGILIIPILQDTHGTDYTLQNGSVVAVDEVNGERVEELN